MSGVSAELREYVSTHNIVNILYEISEFLLTTKPTEPKSAVITFLMNQPTDTQNPNNAENFTGSTVQQSNDNPERVIECIDCISSEEETESGGFSEGPVASTSSGFRIRRTKKVDREVKKVAFDSAVDETHRPSGSDHLATKSKMMKEDELFKKWLEK